MIHRLNMSDNISHYQPSQENPLLWKSTPNPIIMLLNIFSFNLHALLMQPMTGYSPTYCYLVHIFLSSFIPLLKFFIIPNSYVIHLQVTRLLLSLYLIPSFVQAFKPDPSDFLPFPFNPGFDICNVAHLAEELPSHSWEFGTASEAFLELYNPSISVFGEKPFPAPYIEDIDSVKSLAYAKAKITLNLTDIAGPDVLSDGDGATGDPASLGVSAVLLGKKSYEYAEGANKTMAYLTGSAPRWTNGAISQRSDVAELWSDFMYMAPPFLAYYAVDQCNSTLLKEAVEQCCYYGQVLSSASPTTPAPAINATELSGLWHHIIGPSNLDYGLWSTGNTWAAGGITRVLATVMKAPKHLTEGWKDDAVDMLKKLLKDILEPFIEYPDLTMDADLTRNYLDNNNATSQGFGEASGSAHMAGIIYRLAVLAPDVIKDEYLKYADGIRHTLGESDDVGTPHISVNGTANPTVDPLCWTCPPYTAGSPEGQAFVVLMYAAWRDCIIACVCKLDSTHHYSTEIASQIL